VSQGEKPTLSRTDRTTYFFTVLDNVLKLGYVAFYVIVGLIAVAAAVVFSVGTNSVVFGVVVGVIFAVVLFVWFAILNLVANAIVKYLQDILAKCQHLAS
jgi:hypothetical protein